MTVKEVYEKYKHLDKFIGDITWLPHNFLGEILSDIWQAVKEEATEEATHEIS